MKNLIQSIRLTLTFCILFALCYVFVLWGFAQFAGAGKQGNIETVTLNGEIVGAAHVGQQFTSKIYFWGRPSCAGEGYDGTSSAGSNKGVTNQEYLDEVSARTDSFLVHHPYLSRNEVTAEMVTASASGLDPHITPQSALIQVKRVATARHLDEADVKKIVEQCIESPLLGLFGPKKVNVLKLNVALEKAFPMHE